MPIKQDKFSHLLFSMMLYGNGLQYDNMTSYGLVVFSLVYCTVEANIYGIWPIVFIIVCPSSPFINMWIGLFIFIHINLTLSSL